MTTPAFFFKEHIWFCSNSVYIDKSGIFFIDKKNEKHKNFNEITDCVLVLHMPFSNILNYDFKQYIEYEPIFYIKHEYLEWRNLYSDHVLLQEKEGTEHKCVELSQSKMIVRFSRFSYALMRIKLFLLGCLKRKGGNFRP